METRTFHYSRITGTLLFALLTAVLFLPLLTDPQGNRVYYIVMSVLSALCLLILFFLLKTWLIPAFRNEPVITTDDKAITLNRRDPILWTEIDTIFNTGRAIGIRLKDLDKFLSERPFIKNGRWLKLNDSMSGFHFGISTAQIKESHVCDVLRDYLDRFGNS